MSRYDINSNTNLVKLMIENEKKANEQYLKENTISLIPLFASELQKYGFSFEVPSQISGFLPKHKKIILPIAVKYYKNSKKKNEKNFFMGLFNYKGFEEVIPMLLKDFYSNNPLVDRWVIGDRLYQIRSKKYIDDYLKIVVNTNYGISRQMIVLLLGKLKEPKAIPILINLLNDSDVTGHAINALSQYKQEELRPYFDQFLNHKNSFYRREAKKAVKKLNSR